MNGKDELRDVQEPRASLGAEREARLRRRNFVRPTVDIYSTESEMVVLADVPGLNKKHLEVSLDKDELVIEGRAAGREQEESALPWGYYRRFRLRTEFDRSGIRAGLRAGILKITLPKAISERRQSVSVD